MILAADYNKVFISISVFIVINLFAFVYDSRDDKSDVLVGYC